jgi:hypothetical protein
MNIREDDFIKCKEERYRDKKVFCSFEEFILHGM